MTINVAHPATKNTRLWVEFVLFYVVAPVFIAVFFPPTWVFPVLAVVSIIGLILLHFTDSFQWRDMLQNASGIGTKLTLKFALVTAMISLFVIYSTAPEAAFGLIRENPVIILIIAVFYPILSVIPQELVYRPLFFRRYGAILPAGRAALVVNAALFSLAHLMYWNLIVAAMTFAGGLVFAWAYEEKRSFGGVVILHSVAGVILFACGLGIYFYSGNVVRPF